MVLPGNGMTDGDMSSSWYNVLAKYLRKEPMFKEVICVDMPDPFDAHMRIWMPFIEEKLGHSFEDVVLIGHSSGAQAVLRFMEKHKIHAGVVISGCHTDMHDAHERESGWYEAEWNWAQIKANAKWILQFHSTDDPFVDFEEGQFVANQIKSDFKV
mmetsp:Transcript_38711/g.84477  ORF Transcript_38711/g.84477 Transcript_38711/m.84477 type:complete len:156 (+) Transcript_38711:20-487(+)